MPSKIQQWNQPPKLEIDPKKAYTATLKTEKGDMVFHLHADKTQVTVNNFVFLARQGYYNGTIFHRVINDFMAQGGDPTGTGTGGSDLPDLPAEFSDAPFERGTVGMARSNDPNSANSQFFICFAEASFLNGQYTVFGNVVQGMEFVDKIKRGNPAANGTVTGPDRMVRVRVATDIR